MHKIWHPSHLPNTDRPNADFKGPCGPLQHRCGLCSKPSSKLSRCTGCQVFRYCSRDHQVQHRQVHKSICSKIKKRRAKHAKEEHAVRDAIPDFPTPANAFETSVGHFWVIHSTRNYMRARFELADTVRRGATLDGVIEALDHMRDMLRLCRSDNMGVRDLIPPMMLQLDQDQECYDFIKWYETEGQRSDYDWGDMGLPFLNVKGANMLEGVEFLNRKYGHVQHMSAVLLLKLKLLVDIILIKTTRKVIASRLPPELWERIELYAVRSPVSGQWVGKSYGELTSAQQKVQLHVNFLVEAIQNINEHFVHALLNADEYLSSRPRCYSRGSFEEMLLLLQYSYPAWWQHEGVLQLLRSTKSIAAKDSEDDTEVILLDEMTRIQYGYLDDEINFGDYFRPLELMRLLAKVRCKEDEQEERILALTEEDEDEDEDEDVDVDLYNESD